MILKFDHLSYICERNKKKVVIQNEGEPTICEIDLPNLNIKKKLMKNPQDNHDLLYYEKDYPIEYIFYDTIAGDTNVRFCDDIVYGVYYDLQLAYEFLQGIFGRKVEVDNNKLVCNMRGVLDKKDYLLVLEYSSEKFESYLDDGGYGVITLISNSKINATPIEGICTEIEGTVVNGKKIDVCFLKPNSLNIIFEVIQFSNTWGNANEDT